MMKNLEKMTDDAIEIVKSVCGEDSLTKIYRPITINTRAKSRWGRCSKSSDDTRSRIEISSRILRDDTPDDATMAVIIHELLHACKGTTGHKGLWKVYANKISKAYPQYEIHRTDSAERFGLSEEQTLIRKYAIKCSDCGYTYHSSKLSKSIVHPDWYRCKCGGNLVRIA